METSESLLRAILSTLARSTFPPNDLLKIVAPLASSHRQLDAYNLCDGKTPQTEIGKKARLDKGSLSRTIAHWIESGIVVRVGKDQHPMHVYPLTKRDMRSPKAER